MAPNRQTTTMEASNSVQFKEIPIKVEKRPTRCSSVSYSEEESPVLDSRAEYNFPSLVSSKKTSCFILSNVADTFDAKWWPGVSSGLDEDVMERKLKQRVVLEPEEKKEAVENDDQSSGFCWQQARDRETADEKEHVYVWKSITDEVKHAKTESNKEDISSDLFVIPYSVQESATPPENVSQLEQMTASESFEVQEVFPTKDETSPSDDWAEVKFEKVKLEDKETQRKSLFRRHAIRKVKRSVWCIVGPEPPLVQCKRIKKAYKTVKARKYRQPRARAVKQSSVHDEAEQSTFIQNTKPSASKRKRANNPAGNEPRDSGVHSDNSNSGSSGGYSGGSGSSSGSFAGGSGSTGGAGKQGNSGGDDDDKKKKEFPQWHLPCQQDNAAKKTGKKKRVKQGDEEKGYAGEEKMEVDYVPVANATGFPMFLPSKVDITEQCHSPGEGEPITTSGKSDLNFFPSDLQHACYCSSPVCHNIKCKDVKAEVDHMKVHKAWKLCGRCVNTRNIVKKHAKFCRRTGCRVPDCESLRSSNNLGMEVGQPVPLWNINVQPQPYWTPPRTLYCSPLTIPRIDGKVIFRNSTLLPESYFSEHVDYNVMRKNKLGNGSNGNIYPICMQTDLNKEMVVKETNYPIPKEEVEVYRALGEHEHIVTHYGATFRGSEGLASIFMEKCEQSLFHCMEKMQRRLSLNEAMFYWLQILDAVDYLHNLSVPVIHKDIKAKNVLLTAEGARVKLADFDSAKRLPHELTEAGLKPLGTKGFVSPEVLDMKPHGRPTDVYGLGCCFLELTVGVPTKDTLQEKIDCLKVLNPELGEMVQQCVKHNPEERPSTRRLSEWSVVQRFKAGQLFLD